MAVAKKNPVGIERRWPQCRSKSRRKTRCKVISGRDKGKTGRVLRVDRETGKVLVEHVMMVKRHTRPNPSRQIKGGIAERESPIAASNVMIVCPGCNKAVRIAHHVDRVSGRQEPAHAGVPQVRADARPEVRRGFHGSAFERALSKESGSGSDQGVRVQERDGRAEDARRFRSTSVWGKRRRTPS